jgi:hypothetical protein
MEKIYKTPQQEGEAKTVEDENEEKQLFVTSYFATNNSTES